MLKKMIGITFVLFLILIGFRVQQRIASTKIEQKDAAVEAVPVKIMTVQPQTLQRSLEYIGNVRAQEEAVIYAKVSGKVLEKVREEGTSVQKGETLVLLDRDEVGLTFERAPVESTLTGMVGRVYVDIGTNVTSSVPIALVADMSRVRIEVGIPEKYLPNISMGQPAEIAVDAYPDKGFAGQVSKIAPVVDPATRTALVEVTVENPDNELKPGMFARVRMVAAESRDAAAIPQEAVIGREPEQYAFIIENNKAVLRKISLGLSEGALVEVTDGIRAGEKVVIMGQQRLSDGTTVLPEE